MLEWSDPSSYGEGVATPDYQLLVLPFVHQFDFWTEYTTNSNFTQFIEPIKICWLSAC